MSSNKVWATIQRLKTTPRTNAPHRRRNGPRVPKRVKMRSLPFRKRCKSCATTMPGTSSNGRSKRQQQALAALSSIKTGHALKIKSMIKNEAFEEVYRIIDEVVAQLDVDDDKDRTDKDECEDQRAKKTLEAKEEANSIDDKSARIAQRKKEIEDLQAQVEDKQDEKKKAEEEEQELQEQRTAQNAAFVQTNEDDAEAVRLIEKAIEALKKFKGYSGLVEVKAHSKVTKQPKMFEDSYEGKKGEGQGVIAIMELIKKDVEKDKDAAQKTEDDLQADFDDFKATNEEKISGLEEQIDNHEISIGEKDQAISDRKEEQQQANEVLNNAIKTLKDITPGCDFITVNFQTRKKNRELERDGLKGAKAALQGANLGFLQC